MKKKTLSIAIAAVMTAAVLAGCGGSAPNQAAGSSQASSAAAESSAEGTTGAPEETAKTESAGDASEDTAQTASESTAEAAAESTAEDSSGGGGEKILRAGATSGFFGAESLDVAYSWDGWLMSIYGISENLFRLDTSYIPQPWIAESYEQIDDNTWEFTIRDDVKFSNGKDVDAQAVKDCFTRTYETNERAGGTLAIESMEADGQKLTIVTSQPDPTMLNDLCDPLLGIYDAAEDPDPVLGVSCTGPYKAVDFASMEHVSLVKNADYWRGEPKLDGVELSIIDDQNTLTMALQNGEIDIIGRLDASASDLFTDPSEYTIDSAVATRSAFMFFNLQNPGMDDLAVRLAIGYCVDRESFADVVYNGYAEPSYGVFSTAVPFGGTDGLVPSVDSYDTDKAASLLADAGYEDTNGNGILDKDGVELEFDLITYSYNTETLQLADMMESDLSKVGIKLNILTYDSLYDLETEGKFDIALDSYAMAPIGTPQYFTNMCFITDGTDNFGKYSNPDVDELAKKMSTTFDTDEQYSLSKEINQHILDDRAFDFVGSTNLIFAYKNNVSGVEVNPSEYYMITSDIDVER